VPDCAHGTFDKESGMCKCNDGWGTAGITDTVDFLGGLCQQYHCVDDQTCEEVLGIPGASCPAKGGNC